MQTGIEPEDRTTIALSEGGDYVLTPEMDETRFLFRNQVKPYFKQFAPQGNISFLNYLSKYIGSKGAVISYLGFDVPQSKPDNWFESGGFVLEERVGSPFPIAARSFGCEAFGIFRKSAESGLQYDLTTIRDANSEAVPAVLKNVGVPALETMLVGPLNEGLMKALRRK